jgi:hypothetical protein
MVPATRARLVWPCICGLLCIGCKTANNAPPARDANTRVTVNGKPLPNNERPAGLDTAVKSDPCAARLHAISGAMLEYFALNNRLPPKLDDLRPLLDVDRSLSFTCPVSGTPYAYVPRGLVSQDDNRQIILHDPQPDRTGMRWVILMQRPQGRQPAAMWVVSLSDPMFRAYAAPADAPKTTTRPTTRP